MKPDIAAPGVNVISSISSFTDADYTPFTTVTFNGRDYDFARFSGTSMSSPCVAGIVALILDANPTLSPAQVKNILKTTARLDTYTGTITAPGHPRWGMGKVNAYQAVVLALSTVSIEELENNNWMAVYPNPASGNIQLLLPDNAAVSNVAVISADGRRTGLPVNDNTIDCSGLTGGTYFIEAQLSGKILRTKFVKL